MAESADRAGRTAASTVEWHNATVPTSRLIPPDVRNVLEPPPVVVNSTFIPDRQPDAWYQVMRTDGSQIPVDNTQSQEPLSLDAHRRAFLHSLPLEQMNAIRPIFNSVFEKHLRTTTYGFNEWARRNDLNVDALPIQPNDIFSIEHPVFGTAIENTKANDWNSLALELGLSTDEMPDDLLTPCEEHASQHPSFNIELRSSYVQVGPPTRRISSIREINRQLYDLLPYEYTSRHSQPFEQEACLAFIARELVNSSSKINSVEPRRIHNDYWLGSGRYDSFHTQHYALLITTATGQQLLLPVALPLNGPDRMGLRRANRTLISRVGWNMGNRGKDRAKTQRISLLTSKFKGSPILCITDMHRITGLEDLHEEYRPILRSCCDVWLVHNDITTFDADVVSRTTQYHNLPDYTRYTSLEFLVPRLLQHSPQISFTTKTSDEPFSLLQLDDFTLEPFAVAGQTTPTAGHSAHRFLPCALRLLDDKYSSLLTKMYKHNLAREKARFADEAYSCIVSSCNLQPIPGLLYCVHHAIRMTILLQERGIIAIETSSLTDKPRLSLPGPRHMSTALSLLKDFMLHKPDKLYILDTEFIPTYVQVSPIVIEIALITATKAVVVDTKVDYHQAVRHVFKDRLANFTPWNSDFSKTFRKHYSNGITSGMTINEIRSTILEQHGFDPTTDTVISWSSTLDHQILARIFHGGNDLVVPRIAAASRPINVFQICKNMLPSNMGIMTLEAVHKTIVPSAIFSQVDYHTALGDCVALLEVIKAMTSV